MFGFGNSQQADKKREEENLVNIYIPAAMNRTFGTDDPETINKIWRTYMPEITKAILGTEAQTSPLRNDHVDILDRIDGTRDNLMAKLDSLEQQNKDLQEKFNAMMDLLARQAEKENGKGR